MKLEIAIEEFVRHKQGLGLDFRTNARILRAFRKAAGDVDTEDVTQEVVRAFIHGKGPVTETLRSKLSTLRGLYRYMFACGYVTESPLPTETPKQPESLISYIYKRAELRRILQAANEQGPKFQLESHTLRSLVLLLYGAALRLSEALRLTLADVRVIESLLIIRDTKFYKTRWVPMGPDLAKAIRAYSEIRCERKHPSPPEGFLLLTRDSRPVTIQLAEDSFKHVCKVAGIYRKDRSRYGPRLHDLRHSFAVHRLIACYRGGGDVQRLLPKLATFLGHSTLGHTQRYLTLTPELLRHASERFEKYANRENQND